MNLAAVDWGQVFGVSVSPLELFVRGAAIYWFVFILFRTVLGATGPQRAGQRTIRDRIERGTLAAPLHRRQRLVGARRGS